MKTSTLERVFKVDFSRLTDEQFAFGVAVAAADGFGGSEVETAIWQASVRSGIKLPLWRESILDREYGERLGDAAVDAWRCIDREVVA